MSKKNQSTRTWTGLCITAGILLVLVAIEALLAGKGILKQKHLEPAGVGAALLAAVTGNLLLRGKRERLAGIIYTGAIPAVMILILGFIFSGREGEVKVNILTLAAILLPGALLALAGKGRSRHRIGKRKRRG